ncbi:MAG: 4Fe-4S dicluster domain-containing protein [Candidatus Lokiarchaeota archaeon]|nr:4Fe-4S dicluster domain-containing protein [Candidatus Lokiarchaeota archaeon]
MVRMYKEFPGVEWVEGTGDFIRIDNQKCIGCSNCIKVCLAGCFEIVNKKVRVKNLEKCMECASCWYICQEDAIIFTWPLGGTGYQTDWG